MIKLLLSLSVVAIAFTSCQKNNTPAPAKVPSSDLQNLPSATTAVTPGTDVYVVGSYLPNPLSNSVAAYWKNGTLVSLSGGLSAMAIAVSGNDVYAVGASQPINGLQHAVYWKNGTINNLDFGTSTTYESTAYAVFINGSDVYIAGEYDDRSTNTIVYKPILWKNGVGQDLSYNSLNAFPGGVAVIGNDVYVTGFSTVNPNSTRVATVWKNGVPTRLTGGQITSSAGGIAVNGSDIYISGITSPAPNFPETAVYWKNGVLNPIRSNATAAAITVNNNNVYVAGLVYYSDGNNQAVSWKNGVATVYGPLNTLVNLDIAVSGNDTYVLSQSGYTGDEETANIYYYKNGTPVQVAHNAYGSHILVVQH